MKLRLANLNEAEICYQCIEDARAYHKSLGFEQWHPDYPTEQTIKATKSSRKQSTNMNPKSFARCIIPDASPNMM